VAGRTGSGKTPTVLEDGVPEIVRAADTDTVMLPDGASLEDAVLPVAATARPVPMRPGALIPGTRYRLVRWLGDGGMGTVFEAVHEDLDRRVALKVLRDAFSPSIVELFRREARALGRLGSRFVVDVHDLIELADGRLMIAMELVEGETLRAALEAAGVLPVDRIVAVGRQICKGLGAAHEAGIIHRDVKPENIVLGVNEGRGDAVKLLDFGISQVGDDSKAAESRAGTPGYLAPEVISGVGGDHRADIYALGCTLYELATGTRPFEREDPSDILLAQLSERPEPPSTRVASAAPLDRVILRCLKKNAQTRFSSMAELEAALCEVQIAAGFTTPWDDLAPPDVDPEDAERLRRRMPTPRVPKRRWLPWAIAGAVVVAGIGVWAGYAVGIEPDPQADVLGQADALIRDARAAAARAFFVYPPPEEPSLRTALTCVVELESLDGPAAEYGLEQAKTLRNEFADTLERLGDEYWDAEGGKPFALDYYAEALVFDASRERARARASMTPGELRLLRKKAQDTSFTAQELAEVEPLIALADVTEDERSARLDSIERSSPGARERAKQLRTVVRARGRRKPKASAPPPVPKPQPTPSEEVLDVPPIAVPDVGTPSVGEPAEVGPDPALAKSKTKAADAEHRKGNSARAEALYAEALGADRRHAPAHRGLGKVAFDRGDYALAARRLAKAVRLAPRRASYRIELGDALFKSFDYDGAHAQYTRAEALGSSAAAGRLAKVAKKR